MAPNNSQYMFIKLYPCMMSSERDWEILIFKSSNRWREEFLFISRVGGSDSGNHKGGNLGQKIHYNIFYQEPFTFTFPENTFFTLT